MELDVTTHGALKRHQLTVSCKPPSVSQIGAATYINDSPHQDSTGQDPIEPNATSMVEHELESAEPTPEVIPETGTRLPPALVEIDGRTHLPTSCTRSPIELRPAYLVAFHERMAHPLERPVWSTS